MEITVNNQSKIIKDDSLSALVHDMLGEKTGGIAVAVNKKVVPREHWNRSKLKQSDEVLIIRATQGG